MKSKLILIIGLTLLVSAVLAQPTVVSINRNNPLASLTNAASVTYEVTFSEGVTGVDLTDFEMPAATVVGASVTSVTPSTDAVYLVIVNTGTGNGSLRLDLKASGTGIENKDATPVAIASGFNSGEVYDIDKSAPIITSITRKTASPTNATSVVFTVLFSENVTGVDNLDFSLNASGATGTITTCTGSGTSYEVTVSPVSSNGGTIGLDLNSSGTGIVDAASNSISGGFSGETYTVDNENPTVTSITRKTASPTNATSVVFTVLFSESVTGVDNLDFSLNTSGATGTITSCTGSGTTYEVTVNPVSSNGGTLGLNLNSSGTDIVDGLSNGISGGFSGEVYTIDNVTPTVTSISRKTPASANTNASSVTFQVTFSENVANVDISDFSLTSSVALGTIAIVSASTGTIIDVTVNAISGNGILQLDLNPSGTGIVDDVSNPISGGFTSGETYTIDNEAPSVISILRNTPLAANTNVVSVIFKVTFSKNVNNVDISDFSLASSVASGTIASVSASTGTTINVTVNAILGNGTLQLDLKPSGTGIVDDASNPITGGFTSGETYTIDNIVPSVSSILRKTPLGQYTNANSVIYGVTFSEDVTGVDVSDFQLTTTTGSATGSIASVSSASGNSIDVTINSITGNGRFRLEKKLGTGITDVAGNLIGNAAYTGGEEYTIDKIDPTVVLSNNHADAIVLDADVVRITATFTDANNIDVVVSPTISIGAIVTNAPMVQNTNKIWYYDWDVPSGNDGAVAISITAKDVAGNANAAATGTTSFTIDNIAPNQPNVNGTTPTNDVKPTWTWTSGGGGNGTYRYKLNSNDFSSGTTTNTNTSFTPSSNLSEELHTLYIQERDVAGNWSTISSFAIEVDLTTLIPTLTYPAGNSTSNSSISVDFNLPEAAKAGTVKLVFDCTSDNGYTDRVVTFRTPDFETFGNHTAILYGEKLTHLSDGVTVNPEVVNVQAGSGGPKLFDGQTYQVYIEYQDVLGNTKAASLYNTGFKYQVSPPALNYVRIFSNNSNSSFVGVGGTVNITFTSTTDLSSSSVIVKIAGNSAIVSGSGKVWNAVYTMKSSDSDIASPFFTIDFKDIVNNTGVQVVASTDGSSVTFDKTTPTILTKIINSSVSPLKFVKTSSTINASITASEPVEGVVFRLNGLPFSTPINTTGNTWTASYNITGTEMEGPVSVTTDCKDKAGNSAAQVFDNSITFDKTAPVISNVSIKSSNANPAFAKVNDDIILTFTSNEDILRPAVLINSIAANVVTVGGSKKSWIATRKVGAAENQASVIFSIPCVDTTGNVGITKSLTTDASSVTVDRTPPAVTLSNVTVPSGNYGIGSIIAITIPSDANFYIGNNVTVNGYPATFANVGGNTYKLYYTVLGAHNSYSGNDLPITFDLVDKAGNTTSIVKANLTGGTTIEINTKPTYQITGTTSRCATIPAIPAIVKFTFSGIPPYDFVYSVDGVSQAPVLGHTLNTYDINTLKGTYVIESLKDATGHDADITSEQAVVTEIPLPVIDFVNSTLAYSTSDPRVLLANEVKPTPTGGQFSGDGVVKSGSDYYFYPSIVSDDHSDIIYEVTVDGCSNTRDLVINLSNSGYFSGLNSFYCKEASASTSVIIEPKGIVLNTSNQIFTLSPASNFSRTIDITHFEINPREMKAGNYTLFYNYKNEDNGSNAEIKRTFTIDSVGVLVDFETSKIDDPLLKDEYCANDPEIILVAKNLYPSNGTGHFFGPATGFIATNNTATLTPSTVTPKGQTFTISYYYQSENGCKSTTIEKDTKIKNIPTVSFTLRDNYNYDEASIDLQGNHFPDGEFTGDLIESNKKTLNPKRANKFGEDITITYTYLDTETGCSASTPRFTKIHKADQPINYIEGGLKVELPRVHCWAETLDLNITCEPNIGAGPISGVFTSKKGAITQLVTPSNSAVYSIPKAAIKDGIDTIWFSYSINSTPYVITKRVEIDSIGPLSLDLKTDYCANDNPILILGTHRDILGRNSFKYKGGTPSAFYFDAFSATLYPNKEVKGEGPYDVTYIYTTERGNCKDSVTNQVRINPVPIANFEVEADCPKKLQTVTFKNTTTVDAIWYWDLAEGRSYAKDTIFNFKSSGVKIISLKATSNKGCFTTKTKQISIEAGLAADFTWSSECLTNDKITFTYPDLGVTVKTAKWSLDGVDTLVTDESTTKKYLFNSVGEHNIKLAVYTAEGCKDSITKKIAIQPFYKFNELPHGYSNSFEELTDKWFARSETFKDAKWERGLPTGDIFSGESSTNAWFTNVGLTNQAEEKSYVLSPCFDFTGLEKPMIKLNIWSAPEPGRDGAVLQYSTDGGQTWETGLNPNNVGEVGKGVNWYDPGNISSKPAGQDYGWSNTDAQTTWKTARYSLDNLKGQTNVKFRIYYANEGRNIKPFNGFAFDDVWIGDKQQNILNEYFTNTSADAANTAMGTFEVEKSKDVIPIHYHLDDNFYSFYTEGPSSRKFYYGVSQIPSVIANGNITSAVSNLTEFGTKVDAATLLDPKIAFQKFEVVNGDINFEIKALTDLPAQNLVLYCALVKISKQDGPSGPMYYNVLRRFFPSPGGVLISSGALANATVLSKSIPMYYSVADEFINSRLVAFVQNANTNEVYQVAVYNTSATTSDKPMDLSNLVEVYPNPARDYLIVECEQNIDKLMVFDLAGRVVGSYIPAQTRYNVPVQNLQGGVYILKGTTKKGEFIRKFVKQ